MSALDRIPVKVMGGSIASRRHRHKLRTVLQEIEAMVAILIESGQGGTLDLRSRPMQAADYAHLKEILAPGEVSATVKSLTRSRVHETVYPGVWWITHYNSQDEIMTELIEVGWIPQILPSDPEDVRVGRERLRERLQTADVPHPQR